MALLLDHIFILTEPGASVADEYEAASGPGKNLRFVDRWKNQDASPFGAVVRPDATADARERAIVPLMLSNKDLDRMDQFPDHLPD